jgi:murein DD-endopeptidase MepM/ murein hydrolase activator NlpD
MKRIALALAALLLVAAGDPRTETEHVVTRGETLRSIASKAGVPISVIAEANGMLESARVRVGEKLVIPRQQSHTVKRGETAFGIAYQYGVTWEQIAVANGLRADAVPRQGQKLIIPALMPTSTAPPPSPVAKTNMPSAPAFRRPLDGDVLLGWQRHADGTGHEGIDYAAKIGDTVHAAAAGRVIFAGNVEERFGNLVVLDHGNGWHTAYGNLSRITVKIGARVKAGERIGLAGQTGDARRPELHFEIRRGTDPVDPAPLLKD